MSVEFRTQETIVKEVKVKLILVPLQSTEGVMLKIEAINGCFDRWNLLSITKEGVHFCTSIPESAGFNLDSLGRLENLTKR